MRKVLALLLALTTALSMGVMAFAAEDTTGILSAPGVAVDADVLDATEASPRITAPLVDTENDISLEVEVGDLVLIDVTEGTPGKIVYPESRLIPGEDYTFEIHQVVSISGNDVVTEGVTTGNIGTGNRLRLTGKKGTSAVSSAKIETKRKQYILEMTTKSNYGTKKTDTEYQIQSTGILQVPGYTSTERSVGTASFKIGYSTVSDDVIDEYGEGDILTIDLNAPVITKKQLDRVAKENNYRPVILEGEEGDWTFEGRISGMSDTNFIYDFDVVPAIVERFENQDFKFLNFKGGVNLPSNGTMTIDVSDISGDFRKMVLYAYRDGRLEKLSPTYDAGNDELTFRTNQLGTFVITDAEITDTTIIAPESSGVTSTPETSSGTGIGGNPNTGSTSTGIALAFAVASLGSAAVLGRKKK